MYSRILEHMDKTASTQARAFPRTVSLGPCRFAGKYQIFLLLCQFRLHGSNTGLQAADLLLQIRGEVASICCAFFRVCEADVAVPGAVQA
jgi:hypothetical protein